MWLIALHAALGAPHLVVISMDTTRADALSCYRDDVGPWRADPRNTPNLDALAATGVRFERFWTHAPTTLNAHTTMLTGMDPHEHAVVRNGFPFDRPGPTLATRLAGRGYDTIAVVGSAALERAMGLTRGFRVYDDRTPELLSIMFQDRAEGVVRRTFEHLDRRAGERPLFLFVHFYDPHTPYDPPQRFIARHADPTYAGAVGPEGDALRAHTVRLRQGDADPADTARVGELYLAEVAYVDEQIGVLLQGLRERGLLEEALVVVTADHGESLADLPAYAYSHGSNVHEAVMHVPLIVAGYGVPVAQGAVVRRHAAMTGLAPTIEVALGMPRTLGDHPDFYPMIRPGPAWDEDGWPERPTARAFFEASRPRTQEATDAWNNLPLHRGVFAGGYGLWLAPFLGQGPEAFPSSGSLDGALTEVLVELLGAWDAAAPAYRAPTMSPATVEALKALGYIQD